MLLDTIILSYHKFTEEPEDYPFSRTYDQFHHDIKKKVFDLITIDDGMRSMIKACDLMRAYNVRAKLFICPSLVGKKGYCSWDELRELSKFHDIENHSLTHRYLTEMDIIDQAVQICDAQRIITEEVYKAPRYFVPPYNTFNEDTEIICRELKITLLKDRLTIKNDSK